MLFTNDCFVDHTSVWSSEVLNYDWIYDPSLRLLMLFPNLKEFRGIEKQVWLKILKACQLHHWIEMMQDKHSANLSTGHFILNADALQLLIKTFTPKRVWFIGDESFLQGLSVLNPTQFIHTMHYQSWLKHPTTKKNIWLNWLKVQDMYC